MRFFTQHYGKDEGRDDEAEMAAIDAVNTFPWFWCDRCGGGPYRFAHYVDDMKLCADCWLHSLPKRRP